MAELTRRGFAASLTAVPFTPSRHTRDVTPAQDVGQPVISLGGNEPADAAAVTAAGPCHAQLT